MAADGRHREAELLGDLLVAQALPHQTDDLHLARGEQGKITAKIKTGSFRAMYRAVERFGKTSVFLWRGSSL